MDYSMIPVYLTIALPILMVIKYVFEVYQAKVVERENLKKGIGRGVSGFQTSVRRVAIPPEIMERIRRGEEVSGEEITRAQERLAAASNNNTSTSSINKVDNQWLPASHSKSSPKLRKK